MKLCLKTILAFLLLLALGACPVQRGNDDDSAGDEDEPEEDLISIPDPGTDYAPYRWYDDGGYHGTPETAQAMGIVLEIPEYIQGGIDPETGDHFYVFRTAPSQTEFAVSLFNASSDIEYVHIHDGTGLVFGDQVPATEVISPTQAYWELNGDQVYVLEVHSPDGGFF